MPSLRCSPEALQPPHLGQCGIPACFSGVLQAMGRAGDRKEGGEEGVKKAEKAEAREDEAETGRLAPPFSSHPAEHTRTPTHTPTHPPRPQTTHSAQVKGKQHTQATPGRARPPHHSRQALTRIWFRSCSASCLSCSSSLMAPGPWGGVGGGWGPRDGGWGRQLLAAGPRPGRGGCKADVRPRDRPGSSRERRGGSRRPGRGQLGRGSRGRGTRGRIGVSGTRGTLPRNRRLPQSSSRAPGNGVGSARGRTGETPPSDSSPGGTLGRQELGMGGGGVPSKTDLASAPARTRRRPPST